MSNVAVVAIVAMLLSVLALRTPLGDRKEQGSGAASEVILEIAPPQTMQAGLTLPVRNPHR